MATCSPYRCPLGRLDPSDAVNLAQDGFMKDVGSWTADQKRALEEYEAIAPNIIAQIDSGHKTFVVDRDAFPSLIKLFGRMFFAGRLQAVRYRSRLSRKFKDLGMTVFSGKTLEIHINRAMSKALQDEKKSQTVLATLLHECVHAYLHETVCGFPGSGAIVGCVAPECQETYARAFGVEGHGEAYHLLAFLVERRANELFVDLNTPWDLGRQDDKIRYEEENGKKLDQSIQDMCFPSTD